MEYSMLTTRPTTTQIIPEFNTLKLLALIIPPCYDDNSWSSVVKEFASSLHIIFVLNLHLGQFFNFKLIRGHHGRQRNKLQLEQQQKKSIKHRDTQFWRLWVVNAQRDHNKYTEAFATSSL
jgi:hypothetical protein